MDQKTPVIILKDEKNKTWFITAEYISAVRRGINATDNTPYLTISVAGLEQEVTVVEHIEDVLEAYCLHHGFNYKDLEWKYE